MPLSKNPVLIAIRAKCFDCSGFSRKEVALCPITDCPLYPYRFGKTLGKKVSPEVRERLREYSRRNRERATILFCRNSEGGVDNPQQKGETQGE